MVSVIILLNLKKETILAKTFIAWGDVHIPNHNEVAVNTLLKVHKAIQPNYSVCMGDLLDCSQFSAHAPTYGDKETFFCEDLNYANRLIDSIQDTVKERTVVLGGNHEYRIERWAAASKEGRAVYNMVCPRINLSRNRSKFTYISYGGNNGSYPHYKLGSRIICVHGWSYAKNATATHLTIAQGKSVLHGHTHRAQHEIRQNIWGKGSNTGMSTGCLSEKIPTYGTGTPVEWVNGFVMGYMGKTSDTMYFVPIDDDGRCVLPDGREFV